MKRVLILVEGQTEEQFVKQILQPHLLGLNLSITPTILTSKVVKNGPNFKGGVTSFGKFESDLRKLLAGAGTGAIVTTMLDYYGLPSDFPGMDCRRPVPSPYEDVQSIENALTKHFNDRRFDPFLALHEFEAWLFSCTETLPNVLTQPEKKPRFVAICNGVTTPEEINTRPGHHPAAQIKALFTGYQKVFHGIIAAERIGLKRIRAQCPHFDQWLKRLEQAS